MSMMKTLARVAAGVMLAKGIGSVMKNAQQGGSTTASGRSQGGLLDDLIGGVTGRRTGSTSGGTSGGGLSDILGQVLGGQSGGAGTGRRYGGPNSSGASGGLGGILDQLTSSARGGATARGSSGGGLGDLLGGLLGGAAGGLAQKGSQQQNDASFGELFNDAVVRQDEPEVAPTPEQNAVAALMLRAMIQAAKADGKIDDNEKQRLTGQLGDIDDEERQFIRDQMAAPVDAAALAREVPKGLEAQVYAMSLMAIDFDSKAEAEYLHALAEGMGLSREQVNDIHQQIGVQNLYA
ncbi:MAG: DUF533 domain-containing protein [Paracoccus sp. (in: a-proteobacteria)]|uniref:DUF533 domain-containing protein n=1 Tax=Paracoccus sp. TaxID=267 RepID=UPI0026E08EDC|nr:DUF533 domain-containing protein [Paracoccus sp. (in: a-proteobacteria)]MDO5614169.1 DUF533 domain-containing protein [Paracoccus sp. (in: a-proteobacteria)]